MPSLLTHYFFAQDAFKTLISEERALKGQMDAFSLGSQGPDPLFYYGLLPKRPLHLFAALKKYGNQLHHLDGTALFSSLQQELGSMEEGEEKNVFLAFCYGQFAHYLLDSTAHPYIFYWSGFDEQGALSGKYHYAHAHFEGRIDASLAFERGKEELTARPEKVLEIDPKKLEIISKHFSKSVNRVFKAHLPARYYRNALYNMRDTYVIVNGRPGEKGLMKQLYIPRKPQPAVMNEGHLVWMHPVSGESSSASLKELYEKALSRFKNALSEEGSFYQKAESELNGRTYDGILPGYKRTYKDREGRLAKDD